jgi:hypothetical protein
MENCSFPHVAQLLFAGRNMTFSCVHGSWCCDVIIGVAKMVHRIATYNIALIKFNLNI